MVSRVERVLRAGSAAAGSEAAPAKLGRILVGTSGWSYAHWRPTFYPKCLPESEWLAYYAARLPTVEIDSSFYRLPEKRTLKSWAQAVPERFVFSAKASRYITHMKKLGEPKTSTAQFFRRVAVLGERLGPIVFQLPPRWRFNAERLRRFLASLSRDFRYAFEFRDRSWINGEALDLLACRGAAFCIYELDGYLSPRPVTADFVYVRLHGPKGPYAGSYGPRTLAGWRDACAAWAAQGLAVYIYFDNDDRAYAAKNALRLRRMMEG